MNDSIQTLTSEHTTTPQPRATHDDAAWPKVKSADDKLPVTQSSLAGLTILFMVNGACREWDCASEPPKDAATLLAVRMALGQRPTFNRPVNPKIVKHLQAIIGRAFHATQIGLPTIHNARPIYDRERHIGRAASRADIISKLDTLISSGELDAAPLNVGTTDPIILDAISDTESLFPGLLCEARKRVAVYALEFFRQWPLLNHKDRAEEIKMELASNRNLSVEQIEQLHSELLRAESSAAETLADNANAKLCDAYKPVAEIAEYLLTELVEVLQRQKSAAVASEEIFFEQHGQPRHETTVSTRFNPTLKSIRDQIGRMKAPQGHISLRHPTHPAQTPITGSTFGLEICPGVV